MFSPRMRCQRQSTSWSVLFSRTESITAQRARRSFTITSARRPLAIDTEVASVRFADLDRPGMDIKADVETGSSLNQAFRKYPLYFDSLYCNLVAAGEIGGILDTILSRLAEHIEKAMKLAKKIKGAMVYPSTILAVAVIAAVASVLSGLRRKKA